MFNAYKFTSWLTKYTNKIHAHGDALHNMATLFNNHSYINSSKFSANRHATAAYVGTVVE